MVTATELMMKEQLAECQRERDELVAALIEWLAANDPTDFGCACEPDTFTTPGYKCGPCRESDRQIPLKAALAKVGATSTA